MGKISVETSKFSVVPIHHFPELINQTIKLINEEWPRSIGARLHSLTASKDSLPTCLVLLNVTKSKSDNNTNDPTVLAHLKLTPIPALPFACFIESVVVWKNLRGQGIGKYLMIEAEKYCKANLKMHEIYLSTTDKEDFYQKLGYEPCEPISIFGGPCSFPFRPATLLSIVMCFFTFWTGYSVDHGIPARKLKSKKVQKKDLVEKYYKVLPIHKQPNFLDETIKLINSFWPKSRSERLSILGSSKDDLPMSLIMTFVNSNKSKNTTKENAIINDIFFNSQNIDAPMICQETGAQINVLGHLRLVPVPADDKACFIESMIIRHEFRGKGLGSFFIRQAEKFCEEVLHLKSIFLSTYDSGEFYMKIGFNLTNAICVYGNGEVNNVSKKIYLKKDLNYIEPEVIEEEVKDVYDPTKDYNYNQQHTMENDIVLSGFPFKIERPKSFIDRLCSMLDFKLQNIKYYYSYEIFKREKETRSFHIMICAVSFDAKVDLMNKLRNFGVMCFQDFFERPVDDYDNTLIKHSIRYTNLNYIILKELTKLKADRWIADFKYENCQFHANQNDQWIVVKNLEVIDFLRTPEIPDIPDETIEMWDDVEEELDVVDNLEKLKECFKKSVDENWWITLRRPSEIKLEPLYNNNNDQQRTKIEVESTSCHHDELINGQKDRWVDKIHNSNNAIILGLDLNDY